jgi:ATP-dependent 26S proteasome regulatory subunit
LPRDTGSRERVSNLLNVADGLLGDHLRLHAIATTNISIGQLDPAIVRPGRLAGKREFRRLSRAEAQRLAERKGLALPDQENFSLAELYCGTESASLLSKDRRIGFV